MNEWYYWYEVMPQVDKDLYNDPYQLLEAMRYSPDDRYSFVAPREYIENQLEGKYIGHGFAHRRDSEGKSRILYVYEDSPLYPYGVQRGYIITKINGTTINENSNFSDLLGANEVGVTNTIEFKSLSDSVFEVTSAKKEIQKNSVIHYDTLDVDGKVVGHMVYEEFIEPSYTEFDETFAYFKSTGVEEMIVDLRYNPGGLTDVLSYLANLITGPSTDGDLFLRYQHNNKKSDYNEAILFEQQTSSLDVSRVVFITSRGTASSSEALINCLKPYLDVKVVGDSTYGKPVGMYIFTYSDWAFLPIVFKIVNADGEGEYFFGIPPDVECEDDITRSFSDRQEACLKEAIYYIRNGAFSGAKRIRTKAIPEKKPAYKDLLRKHYLE
jgi:C-terminal processing protease CtpA/Prc